MSDFLSFSLSDDFINEYSNKHVDWGFSIGGGNSLSELTFILKYSRKKEDGTKEQWYESVRRWIEGYYSILKDHAKANNTPWSDAKAQRSAQDAYDRAFHFKWTPPGRGMQHMGTEYIATSRNGARLINCAFLTTENISTHSAYRATMPFVRLIEMSMNGIGVGVDTRGAGNITLRQPLEETEVYVVPDTREGWAASLGVLLESFFFKDRKTVVFDYSEIRPEGAPLKSFGGTSSGPAPLKTLHDTVSRLLMNRAGEPLSSRDIIDITNLSGKAVVSGGARRSALLSLGYQDDTDYVNLKNWDLPENVERTGHDGWAWASNNSILTSEGEDLSGLVGNIALNGEPGFLWVDTMQKYGRLADPENNKDYRAVGVNPCQPGWALLLTPDGITKLEDISIGDSVWSETGWTKVVNKWSTGVKDVNSYRTTAGVFYGTENHRIVSNGVKVEAGEAESIDRLAGPFRISSFDPSDIIDGLVIGDGSVHKASNNKVVLYVGDDDQDYFVSEVSDLIGPSTKISSGGNAYEVNTRVDHTELPNLPTRSIPERYIHGNANKVAGFLRGLYSANGSVVANGSRITLKAASFKIIEQAQVMLSSLGIQSYYTTNKAKPVLFSNGEYECKESYDLNITTDRERFVAVVGFIQGYKMDKITFPSSGGRTKVSFDIKSVDYVSTEEVFDITVDNETHTYWTNGLNVSNCGEIGLESSENCNLGEVYPTNHEDYEDLRKTLKHVYMYTKAVTLLGTPWPETNEVIFRNRRIGISMTGIAQFVETRGWTALADWQDKGYREIQRLDKKYSEWLGIRESIKLTTVKPAGSTSLVAGVTPGVHWPTTSNYHLRRIRFLHSDPLVKLIEEAGYHVEPDVNDPNTTVVATFPTKGVNIRSEREVSVWEKAALAASAQRHWSDNLVSCTLSFTEDEVKELGPLLASYQGKLKSASFLPIDDEGTTYAQAPYEPVSEEDAIEWMGRVKRMDEKSLYGSKSNDFIEDKFCTNDSCSI